MTTLKRKYALAACCMLPGLTAAGFASANNVTAPPKPLPPGMTTMVTPGQAATSCRPGFYAQGYRMCMTGYMGTAQYDNAVIYCQDIGGRVADVNDWRYRIYRGDGVSAPVGWWFGPRTGDDHALFANSSDAGNPDGETSVFDSRGYTCVHDLIR